MELTEFIKIIKQYNNNVQINDDSSYAEKLKFKLTHRIQLTKQGYLDLLDEVNTFLKSDAPDEDKNLIRGYIEPLVMLCNAIREKRI